MLNAHLHQIGLAFGLVSFIFLLYRDAGDLSINARSVLMFVITFHTEELYNFQNIERATVPLEGQGLTVVAGKNGAGKSTILLDGIVWILFGVSLRYKAQGTMYGEAPGNKVMRRGCKSCLGTLTIGVDGQEYLAARGRGRDDYADGLSLFHINEAGQREDLSLGKTRDTQQILNALIGMGPKAFCHSVILTSDILNFPQMPDGKKKEIMDELLGLSALNVGLEATRKAIVNLTAQRSEAASRASALTDVIDSLKQQSEDAQLNANEFEQDRSARLAECQSFLDAIAPQRKALVKRQTVLQEQHKQAKLEIVKLTRFIDDAQQICSTERAVIEDAKSHLAGQAGGIQAQINAIVEWRQQIDDITEPECPVCCAPMDNHPRLPTIKLERGARLSVLESDLRQINAQKLTLAVQDKNLKESEEYMRSEQMKLRNLQKASDNLRDSLSQTTSDISGLKRSEEFTIEKLDSIKAERNVYTEMVAAHSQQLVEKAAKAELAAADVERLDVELADEQILLEAFGSKGVKLSLLNGAIPFLNNEARRIQQMLGTEMSVTFRIRGDGESFAGSLMTDVQNPRGAESYEGDSTGEKSRIDVIIMFSILALIGSRGQKSVAQSCFDESFEFLDQDGQKAVSTILRDIADRKSSVFVVSHHPMDLQADHRWIVDNGHVTFN
jgi:DNA repair exonuclease SbcCD ATPase subunit